MLCIYCPKAQTRIQRRHRNFWIGMQWTNLAKQSPIMYQVGG